MYCGAQGLNIATYVLHKDTLLKVTGITVGSQYNDVYLSGTGIVCGVSVTYTGFDTKKNMINI